MITIGSNHDHPRLARDADDRWSSGNAAALRGPGSRGIDIIAAVDPLDRRCSTPTSSSSAGRGPQRAHRPGKRAHFTEVVGRNPRTSCSYRGSLLSTSGRSSAPWIASASASSDPREPSGDPLFSVLPPTFRGSAPGPWATPPADVLRRDESNGRSASTARLPGGPVPSSSTSTAPGVSVLPLACAGEGRPNRSPGGGGAHTPRRH
jgi:hypothetical protein